MPADRYKHSIGSDIEGGWQSYIPRLVFKITLDSPCEYLSCMIADGNYMRAIWKSPNEAKSWDRPMKFVTFTILHQLKEVPHWICINEFRLHNSTGLWAANSLVRAMAFYLDLPLLKWSFLWYLCCRSKETSRHTFGPSFSKMMHIQIDHYFVTVVSHHLDVKIDRSNTTAPNLRKRGTTDNRKL